jgi:uncharacterized coiled-coil DUF342 family protein
MKKDSEINMLKQLNELSDEINQQWAEFQEKRDTYNRLLEEFYKNIDNQSNLPPHLRMMKK